MSVPLPTLLELSMRMVLQKDLPWDTYPPLKEDFEALERLPGNYKVVKQSERFLKKDEVVPSSELTPWEAEVGDMLKRNNSPMKRCTRISIAKVMSGNPLVLWNMKHYYGFFSFVIPISDRIVRPLTCADASLLTHKISGGKVKLELWDKHEGKAWQRGNSISWKVDDKGKLVVEFVVKGNFCDPAAEELDYVVIVEAQRE